jgi:mycothiol synthase
MRPFPDIAVAALRDEDADEIVALYDRAALAEPGIGPVPREVWRRFVRLPQNLDGRDFRVARDGQLLVAIAESSLRNQGEHAVRFCKFVVDPAYRRRGIATLLLAELLKIDEPGGALSFQCLASGAWTAALAFIKAFGFSHIESEIGMECLHLRGLSGGVPSAFSPERVDNPSSRAAEVASIHNAAYRDDVAFRPFTAEEMARSMDDSALWIVRESSRVVAFCCVETGENSVWLDNIAVAPEYRGRGLGAALVHAALQEAKAGAARPARLNVSSRNPRAISVYERLGFSQCSERLRFSALRDDLAAAVARRLNPNAKIVAI